MASRTSAHCLLCVCAFAALSVSAETLPATGSSLAEAKALLGSPQIEASMSNNQMLLLYPRGRLIFTEGKLSEIDFLTLEQFAARQEAAQLAAEEIAREKARRTAEGLLLWEHLRNSPEFARLSGTARLTQLASLQSRYPDLPLTAEITAARLEAETELARQRVLRAEAAAAEARAREAEAEARLAEQRASQSQGLRAYTYSPWSNAFAPRPVIAIGGTGVYVRPPQRPIIIIRDPKPPPPPVTPPRPQPPKKPSPPAAPPMS